MLSECTFNHVMVEYLCHVSFVYLDMIAFGALWSEESLHDLCTICLHCYVAAIRGQTSENSLHDLAGETNTIVQSESVIIPDKVTVYASTRLTRVYQYIYPKQCVDLQFRELSVQSIQHPE